MSESPISAVGNLARDCVYLAAGVGVIAFQKAQVARREIAERSAPDLSETAPRE
jgi:hypothetical protein